MTQLVLFGHSHLGSITRAYDEGKAKSDAPFDLEVVQFIRNDIPHIIHGENGWQYNPDGARELQEVLETIKPRAIFCSLQGEQAVWAGLMAPERPFDFFFPGENRVGGDHNHEVVPFDLFMEVCKDHHRLASDFLARIRPLLTVPTFGLCPPPPVGDCDFLMERLKSFEVYRKLSERGIPWKAWRQKVWRAHARALADIYASYGIHFVDAPVEALGEDGCLQRSMYWDAFHANKDYGLLVLQQMQKSIHELPE